MNNNNIHLGIAPINWTNDDLPELGGDIPFEQCISEMALAGFTGCEVGNKYPRDTEVLRKYLELRGLRICNQWFSYELTTRSLAENRKQFEVLLNFLQAMGARVIGGGEVGNSCQGKMDVPVLKGKGMLHSEEEWKNFCYGLNELGKMARDRGFKLAFHHHMGTVIQTMAETDRLLENTDPEKCMAELRLRALYLRRRRCGVCLKKIFAQNGSHPSERHPASRIGTGPIN